ncbi:MAG: hypothetical protein K8S99_13530 [Planctomycetes bacterium]|nr:hypothetical protein [Planctomycetota bacterium]
MPDTSLHSASIDDPLRWGAEGADQGSDPDSGAAVRRLTSGPLMNHQIYCEQPYTSPDGRRVAVLRSMDFAFSDSYALLIAEPDTLRSVRIERSIPPQVAHHAWGEWLYYGTHAGAVRRVSFVTLAKEPVLPDGAFAPATENLASITPDGRTIFIENLHPGVETPDRQIVALDTRSGARRVIFTDPDNINGHTQCEPTDGRLLAMQLGIHRAGQPDAVPVHVMGIDGSNIQPLPLGGVHTAESSGHMAWIPGTGRIACALQCDRENHRHDARHPRGNLAIVGPGDTAPKIFAAPDHAFWHISSSRCGRYFVADDFMDFKDDLYGRTGVQGPVRIVIGAFASGKSRVLLRDCKMQGIAGTSRWEPDPYLTADNRYVIFNASPLGSNQVFAARVPEEFLKSLE